MGLRPKGNFTGFAVRCAGLVFVALWTWCFSAVALPARVAPQTLENAVSVYERGDYAAAAALFASLAESGNTAAQVALGDLYYDGQGVAKSYDAALNWYRKAADAGLGRAQLRIGLMYSEGRSVPQDRKQAVRWYRLAAEQGLADAEYNLALAYDFGDGLPQDYAEAVRWYALAADQGLALAQNNLAAMYENGQGVAQDLTQAYKWYSLAAAHFAPDEQEERDRTLMSRDRIVSEMSAQQLADGQHLAKNWKPEPSLSWDGGNALWR
jgi:TPR repeat protein